MKRNILSFAIGIVLGLLIGVCLSSIILSSCNIDKEKQFGLIEYIYYLSQPVSIVFTFLALLIALFGVEIKNIIFSPKCSVSIWGNGFEENLGYTEATSSPNAQFYSCTLVLNNTGSKELVDLSLIMKEVVFINENGKKKKISRFESTLYWVKPEIKKINLRENEQRKIIVARVFPEAVEGTPDNSSKSPLRFSITGLVLDKKYNKKGKWEVKYYIQTPQKIVKVFLLELTWSGIWYNRITEMSNELGTKLKDVKI